MKHKQRELKDFTFEELVNHCAELILIQLMKGEFRSGVYSAIDLAIGWYKETNK